MACRFGAADCLKEANDKLRELLINNRAIHQNNRAAVYCSGMRNTTTEDYLRMWSRLSAETDSTERAYIISGLACSRNTTHLTDFIQTSVASVGDASYVSAAERYRVFSDVAGNGINGTSVAIQFLLDNFDISNSYYGGNNINNAIGRLANLVITDGHRTEVIFNTYFGIKL